MNPPWLWLQIPAILVAYYFGNKETRQLLVLGLQAIGILIAITRVETAVGFDYYLWNAITICCTCAFGWSLRQYRRCTMLGTPRERLAMRQLFGDTLPQLLYRDNRRLSIWRKPR